MKHKWRWMVLTVAMVTTMAAVGLSGCGSPKTPVDDTKDRPEYAKDEGTLDQEGSGQSGEENDSQETDAKPSTSADGADSRAQGADTGEQAAGVFAAMVTEDFNGNAVDSSLFAENDLTLVNVWATWCGPCLEEIPTLDKLSKEYAGTGVAIKGLVYDDFGLEAGINDEVRAAVEEVLTRTGAGYQQLLVSEQMIVSEELRSIMGVPTTFFVDSDGNIVESVLGAKDYDGWKELIEKHKEELTGK